MTQHDEYPGHRFPFNAGFEVMAARDKFLKTGSLRGFGRLIDFPGPAELSVLPDSKWWIQGLIPTPASL
jgi:hypothetical protein